jgi:hypothetical protein
VLSSALGRVLTRLLSDPALLDTRPKQTATAAGHHTPLDPHLAHASAVPGREQEKKNHFVL